MGKTIQKITVETIDNGKKESVELHKDNVKSIHWGNLGKILGEAMTDDMPPPGL